MVVGGNGALPVSRSAWNCRLSAKRCHLPAKTRLCRPKSSLPNPVFWPRSRHLALSMGKRVFATTNFRCEKPRKCGHFPRPEKTLKIFRKNACIENPVLISYSPVAPLRATPDATRRSIFEKRKLEVKENCNVNEIARFLAKRIRAYDGCLGIMRR